MGAPAAQTKGSQQEKRKAGPALSASTPDTSSVDRSLTGSDLQSSPQRTQSKTKPAPSLNHTLSFTLPSNSAAQNGPDSGRKFIQVGPRKEAQPPNKLNVFGGVPVMSMKDTGSDVRRVSEAGVIQSAGNVSVGGGGKRGSDPDASFNHGTPRSARSHTSVAHYATSKDAAPGSPNTTKSSRRTKGLTFNGIGCSYHPLARVYFESF